MTLTVRQYEAKLKDLNIRFKYIKLKQKIMSDIYKDIIKECMKK